MCIGRIRVRISLGIVGVVIFLICTTPTIPRLIVILSTFLIYLLSIYCIFFIDVFKHSLLAYESIGYTTNTIDLDTWLQMYYHTDYRKQIQIHQKFFD